MLLPRRCKSLLIAQSCFEITDPFPAHKNSELEVERRGHQLVSKGQIELSALAGLTKYFMVLCGDEPFLGIWRVFY
jgi:hypothetical protein